MNVDDSPLRRLLKNLLSAKEKASGAFEDPTKPPR
ncbi:hypothetical protein ACVIGV_004835 [Rhizobium leguminosarum]